MSRTVWKYELAPDASVRIHGVEPRVVHVAVDPAGHYGNLPTVWVELEPSGNEHVIELFFIGTGFDVPENSEHVGSCITPMGFVWHVYKVIRRG